MINKYKQIEDIVKRNGNLISRESDDILRELDLDSSEKLSEIINEKLKPNRNLKIGIVGRVKAGKSSLINALLFKGQSVLPKAATPMTAALTTISYSDKFEVDIDVFSENEILDIVENAKNYDMEFERLFKENKKKKASMKNAQQPDNKNQGNWGSRIVKKTTNKIKEMIPLTQEEEKRIKEETENYMKKKYPNLIAAKEQAEQIENSPKKNTIPKNLRANNLDELSKKLSNFVGADGEFMPFTKSVNIKFPNQFLKDITIIDTPGVNDPIVSREERTKELLKECEVVFIVSPAGQFLSNEDKELLEKIENKNGIREIYVIASKIDNTLLDGSVIRDSNNDLRIGLENIKYSLLSQMGSFFDDYKKYKKTNVFDSILKNPMSSLTFSSGIMSSIRNNYIGKEETHILNQLKQSYPDDFKNQEEIVKLLENIEDLQTKIEKVKDKKEEIITKNRTEVIKQKEKLIIKYKKSLRNSLKKKITEIDKSDIEKLKEDLKNFKSEKDDIETDINYNWKGYLHKNLQIDLSETFISEIEIKFNELNNKAKEGEGVRNWTTTTGMWWWKKEHNHSETTFKTKLARDAFNNFYSELSNKIKQINNRYMFDIYETAPNIILGKIKIDKLNLDLNKLENTIKKIVNDILKVKPQLPQQPKLPSNLDKNSTLFGKEADRYIKDFNEYFRNQKDVYIEELDKYINSFYEKYTEEIDIAEMVLGDYVDEMKKLQQNIENKDEIKEKLRRIIKQIEGIK